MAADLQCPGDNQEIEIAIYMHATCNREFAIGVAIRLEAQPAGKGTAEEFAFA